LDAVEPLEVNALTTELLDAIEESRESALTSALATLEMLANEENMSSHAALQTSSSRDSGAPAASSVKQTAIDALTRVNEEATAQDARPAAIDALTGDDEAAAAQDAKLAAIDALTDARTGDNEAAAAQDAKPAAIDALTGDNEVAAAQDAKSAAIDALAAETDMAIVFPALVDHDSEAPAGASPLTSAANDPPDQTHRGTKTTTAV
jgi:hypothetical protein